MMLLRSDTVQAELMNADGNIKSQKKGRRKKKKIAIINVTNEVPTTNVPTKRSWGNVNGNTVSSAKKTGKEKSAIE